MFGCSAGEDAIAFAAGMDVGGSFSIANVRISWAFLGWEEVCAKEEPSPGPPAYLVGEAGDASPKMSGWGAGWGDAGWGAADGGGGVAFWGFPFPRFADAAAVWAAHGDGTFRGDLRVFSSKARLSKSASNFSWSRWY